MIANNRARRPRGASLFSPALGYAVAVFAIGLVFRLVFIYQGWAATDEGWLQAMGARIASGQVPYRDFEYLVPPLTIYKEGTLAAILSGSWTVLTSRWLFSAEVSLASVLAFLVVRRFVSDRIAFLTTLPTVFFSVSILAFTNYTYDGEFMALLAIVLAVYADRTRRPRAMVLASGVAAGLAAMCKTPFLAFVPVLPVAAIAGSWLRREHSTRAAFEALRRGWSLYVAGGAITIVAFFAYYALVGAFSEFIQQAFLITAQSHPVSLRFALVQDMPESITYFGRLMPAVLVLTALLLVFRLGRVHEVFRVVALAAVLIFVLEYTLLRTPIPSRPFFLNVAYWMLVVFGLIALVATIAVEGPWLKGSSTAAELRSRVLPPEALFLGLYLQWLAQFHYDGLVFWYMGAFISVPAVLIFVYALSRTSVPPFRSAVRVRIGAPALAPLMLGLWFSIGGAGIFIERVYQDADRPQLTATFSAAKLRGVTTYPTTAQRVNGIVGEVDRLTKPGDPVLFFPDFGILYDATGRTNPTRIDWYNEAFLTPAITDQVLADLKRNPPKVVFLQTQREGAWQRDQAPIDYANSKWAPIYEYLMTHYTLIDTVQDVGVLVPLTGST